MNRLQSRSMGTQRGLARRGGVALLAMALTLTGCDLFDPTEVVNPNVTEGDFVATPNAASSWARGSERQLATAVNQVLMGTEVVSDNLFNNRTLFSKVFDIPLIEASDFDVTNIQRAIHRLRETANRGLEVVVPADANATPDTRAQLHFHRGYASLLAAELFVSLPGEPGGPILTPAEHVQRAVADFEQSRSLATQADVRNAALLAIARAQYLVGNRAAAVAAAQEVRTTAPTLIRNAIFDNTDGPNNTMQGAVYAGQNEFQPLPRLDFLFPKYYSRAAGNNSPVAILKGEEAFLILAEAAISQGDLSGARGILVELLDLVAQRPIENVDDRSQRRGRLGGTWIYPNSAEVLVQASPDSPPRSGLVLTRSQSSVPIPVVSGTSVTEAMLDGATTEAELLYLLYLMRQEIFVLEGRRMTDLGIRYPTALDEALTNPNLEENSPALQAVLPPWIPLDYGLDGFNYDDGDTLAVILHDMNQRIVANRTRPEVVPFH
jgi:hypothetical protein